MLHSHNEVRLDLTSLAGHHNCANSFERTMAISRLEQDSSGILRGLAELQAEMAAGRRLPPVEKWHPAHCGSINMRIARDGTWFYMGTPINRPAMVRLFSTILRREDDDSYVLVTPVEKMTIIVEDVPFLAVSVERADDGPDQTLTFLTNVGDLVVAGSDHPLRVEEATSGEPRPYLHVRGQLEARLSRNVFYELVDLAYEENVAGRMKLGVRSGGVFFPLGSVDGAR